jgi:predicted nucleic acid-binding protein
MGEKRLWQAVILSTIQEWLFGPLRAKRQAEHYLFDDNSELAEVCRSAGMDVGRLRARLARLRNHSTGTIGQSGCDGSTCATRV